MRYIYNIIKADYLQRTRSYGFLITLVITVYAAYSFVPPPAASYTTLTMPGYKGVYNPAWVGYVSAMMTAIMLSLYGFFLVNSGIKKDIDTGVGLIVATTSITNFGYLFSKMLSNFLVLLTIAATTFIVSLAMFFVRGNGSPLIATDFIYPYLLFVIPALLSVSAIAVTGEVLLGKKPILQYIAFIFLFGFLMANVHNLTNENAAVILDPFGIRTMTTDIKYKVNTQFHDHVQDISLGFTFNRKQGFKTFEWNGITFTGLFLASRLLWVGFACLLVYISSFFFHRFDFKQAAGKAKKVLANHEQPKQQGFTLQGVNRATMPPLVADYGILPFIKTELLLLIRKGSKWLWLLNGGVWVATLFAPLNIAYGYLLPILLFLQVTRWSELATKEQTNRLHYFTYASYKPLLRMLPAQILAGITLAVALALPVMVRCIIALNGIAAINILNGSIFIVLLSVCVGIISGGKKLYEILFFLLTYSLCDKIPFADYLGSMPHAHITGYMFMMLLLNVVLATVSFVMRAYQLRHL